MIWIQIYYISGNCYGVKFADNQHPWFVPTTHQYLYMDKNHSQSIWGTSNTGTSK